MVEFETDNETGITVGTSDKMLANFIIEPSLNLFVISLSQGPTPQKLEGKFSNLEKAKEAIRKYLLTKKETQASKSKKTRERINRKKESRDGPTDRTKDS